MENTEKSTFSKWPDRIFGAAVIILSIAVVILIAYPLYFVVTTKHSDSFDVGNFVMVTGHIWQRMIFSVL